MKPFNAKRFNKKPDAMYTVNDRGNGNLRYEIHPADDAKKTCCTVDIQEDLTKNADGNARAIETGLLEIVRDILKGSNKRPIRSHNDIALAYVESAIRYVRPRTKQNKPSESKDSKTKKE